MINDRRYNSPKNDELEISVLMEEKKKKERKRKQKTSKAYA